ncbi:MAG: hypothetical protein ACXAD7_13070 [Candidatus Kariarchaeaceae archaeon]
MISNKLYNYLRILYLFEPSFQRNLDKCLADRLSRLDEAIRKAIEWKDGINSKWKARLNCYLIKKGHSMDMDKALFDFML